MSELNFNDLLKIIDNRLKKDVEPLLTKNQELFKNGKIGEYQINCIHLHAYTHVYRIIEILFRDIQNEIYKNNEKHIY